jgi:tetratricopeptide (TPR) repeat protein
MLSILLTIALMAADQAGSLSGGDLLQRGKDNFRALRYAEAIDDLRAAADAFLSADQKQKYVESGRLETLPQLEEALVYLTIAYAKIGRDGDARETISRLVTAEKIEPHFSKLALTADVAELPAIVVRLAPTVQLPANAQLASGAPAPAVAPAPSVASSSVAPEPAPSASEGTSAALVPPPTPAAAPQPMSTADREEIMREVERRVAEARAQIEKQMAERLAAERAAMERELDTRVAAARAAAEAQARRDVLVNLHKAEILANTGHINEAKDIYLSIANAPAAMREAITEAAIGLYRIGDYADAVTAFRRLGTLARGEEDLRYYEAVSLFEMGQFEEARKQLSCALPYLKVTDDIQRYQSKIESAASRSMR